MVGIKDSQRGPLPFPITFVPLPQYEVPTAGILHRWYERALGTCRDQILGQRPIRRRLAIKQRHGLPVRSQGLRDARIARSGRAVGEIRDCPRVEVIRDKRPGFW